ncbi:hypothetical protein BDR07DRAFT_244637 [Suillus spraguei]|nr:hypothetical protein BDR07DRAFT_244637 [Suillus spraguei]
MRFCREILKLLQNGYQTALVRTIRAVLGRNGILDTFNTKWLVGANGAKACAYETRDYDRDVTGDIARRASVLIAWFVHYSMEELPDSVSGVLLLMTLGDSD